MNHALRIGCGAAAAALVSNVLVACGDGEDEPAMDNTSGVHVVEAEEPALTSPDLGGESDLGGELGAVIGRQPTAPEQPSDEPVPDGMKRIAFRGLRMFVPAEWERQQPASSMREVQMRVPSHILDHPDAGFVVYGGISGTVQQNVQRWTAQFTGHDGMPVQPMVEEFSAGDLRVAVVEITGDYTSAMVPGESGPDMTMIQAIAETPTGEQVFIRLLGSREVVAAHRDALVTGLQGLAPAQ